jgi:uncharacterized protein (TIGR02996 family)
MSVYFTYRRHNLGPSGKYTKCFDDDTVFDWFRNRWRHVPDTEEVHSTWYEDTFGCPAVYGFGQLFGAIGEHSLPRPETPEQLSEYLRRHLPCSRKSLFADLPHCLQVLTDDDELELAYYFYDDHYLKQHGRLAAFLLHDDWRLPASFRSGGFTSREPTDLLSPPGGKEGTVYLAVCSYQYSDNLSHPIPAQALRLEGIRLPDLGPLLVNAEPDLGPLPLFYLRGALLIPPADAVPVECCFLQALAEHPSDRATWAAYADWLTEQGQGPLGRHLLERALTRVTRYSPELLEHLERFPDSFYFPPDEGGVATDVWMLQRKENEKPNRLLDRPSDSLVQADEHVAQLCLQVGQCFWTDRPSFHQWYLFDDLWASAHPDLANGILRYVRRWDVLTPD